MSFDPAPVRLRKKAVKQLKQTNAQQLEVETRRMEDRIRALKEQMTREKEDREKSGGIKWNSSKTCPVNTLTQQGTKKKSTKGEKAPRRIKILSDEPLSSYSKKSSTHESQSDPALSGGAVCGQCDRARAGLICVECGENYCVGCFKTFHQKGALKRHTARSLGQSQNEKDHRSSRNKDVKSSPRISRVSESTSELYSLQNGSPSGQQRGMLLRGSYDEEESSASFAEALREWRNPQLIKSSNTWVNPADAAPNGTSTGTSCGASTNTVAAKPKEIKIEFKQNDTMSYMDRLMLKKHRENPTSVVKPSRPVSVGTSSRPKTKSRTAHSNHISENSDPNGKFGLNYREIFQSVGCHAVKSNHEPKVGRSRSAGEVGQLRDSRCRVTIEEVPSSCGLLEETSACVVEEATGGEAVESAARSLSRSGRVSIMTLTSAGDFREDTEALTLEDISCLSSGSPVSESRSPVKHNADEKTRNRRAAARLSTGSNGRKSSRLNKRAQDTPSGTQRVWSPNPSYTGLSNFFLSGVKGNMQPSVTSKRGGPDSAIGPRAHVSRELLNKATWKPQDSVMHVEQKTQENSDSIAADRSSTSPRVEEPRSDAVVFDVIPIVREPEPNNNSIEGQLDWNLQPDLETSHKIHDFGIVDFLKAGPMPSKGQSDYSLVHRVSTVSPLALSPNPPKLNWSDDDSDDEVIEEVLSQAQLRDNELYAKQDQDVDDSATLNDLAWELESTTGNVTPDVGEVDSLLTTQTSVGEGQDEFDNDSIEEDELGTELNFPDELDCDLDSRDEVDENRASRMEVAALE